MIIIHNKNSKRREAKSRLRLFSWISSYPIKLIAIVVAIGAAFLMGVLAHQQGLVVQLLRDSGLGPGDLGIGRRDRDLPVLIRTVMSEPMIALEALLQAPELPTIHIDMKFKYFNKITAKREDALQRGLLVSSDDDFVPAEIRYQERTIKVKIRLKGDSSDHWDTDKWSYRIQVKGNDQLFGMRRFSIQHPKTRNFLSEKGWLENLRMEGILVPRYQFVNVVFNGTPKGIFALEENFSKELLESQKRREGIIVGFDESNYWERREQLGDGFAWLYPGDHRSAFFETSRSSRIDKDVILSQERDVAIGLLRAFQDSNRTGSEVFDAALLGRFLAINELWDTAHAIGWNNIHFYYNPITAKIEPIGFDGDPPEPYDQERFHALYRPWTIQALRDPAVAEAYVSTLDRISQPDYLKQMRGELGELLEHLQLAMNYEFPFVRSARLWELLEARQDYIRRSLHVTDLVFAFAGVRSASHNNKGQGSGSIDTLQIEVRNVVALPVEIVGFQVGSSFIPADMAWTGSTGEIYTRNGQSSVLLAGDETGNDDSLKYAVFRIRLDAEGAQTEDGESPDIKVATRFLGLSTTQNIPARHDPQSLPGGPVPSIATVEQALIQHPFLEQGDRQDLLLVRKGKWDVDGDLVLPPGVGLQVGPGTTLRFARDAIFVSTGHLEFRGTSEAPIILAPQNDSWSGLVVLEAGAPSVWEHVVVENTRGIEREGWILTGGITFYQSPISLIHSRILGSQAEDGLNIIRSPFEFRDCEFAGVTSDAFDGDFTEGVIEACDFHDIQGDAIDVSGSQVQVSDVVLRDIGDKGLSVGEESQVEAMDILAVNTGIAVASKDTSQVRLEHIVIQHATHAGLAAYTKKPEYGPASITATDIDFKGGTQNTLVQSGSWIDLNGERIEGGELDVEALYAAGILGN